MLVPDEIVFYEIRSILSFSIIDTRLPNVNPHENVNPYKNMNPSENGRNKDYYHLYPETRQFFYLKSKGKTGAML